MADRPKEGSQEFALLLNKFGLGHGTPPPSSHTSPRLGDNFGQLLHVIHRGRDNLFEILPELAFETAVHRVIPQGTTGLPLALERLPKIAQLLVGFQE
jgi:hypothetical protein